MQPHSPGPLPWIAAAIGLGVILWSWQDVSVDPFKPPYELREEPETPRRSPSDSSLKANLPGLIRADDYPPEALLRNEQGTVGARLVIDSGGRVSQCIVEQSSGSAILDTTTCDIFRKRAKFPPAAEATTGERTFSQSVRWQLQ
ncbi:energy transducer TonB [Sphingomonas sinipercae]|uniref:Energy transducer TonB n=1 Tax=Sphingomonas sinipercae TaxID=2714944 RepID=A0A6G7ZNI4_9SPHN|nr:energy transducer TonB [Sphingomonas sinipercae]QIL02544.1 energy transducer TonB [Sphingomonas sinipercae]